MKFKNNLDWSKQEMMYDNKAELVGISITSIRLQSRPIYYQPD